MKKTKILLLVTVIISALLVTSNFVFESDYFWHIKAGELMFKNGPMTHDVFSWFLNGRYWMSHEWLFEVLLYLFKMMFGNYHLLIYPFITILGVLLLIYIPNRDNFSKNIFYSLIYIVFLIVMLSGGVQARPHLLSFIFITSTIYFLYDLYKNENSKKIYFLPLITIIWANAHGGSSNLSYILCLIFFVCGLFKFKFKKIEADKFTKRQLFTYLIISLLCIGAICINIHGVKMLIYPYSNMTDTLMLTYINEWQPTSLSNPVHYIYYIYLIFIIMTMLLSDKKIKLLDFVLLGFVTYLGLKSIRFWVYSPIIMSYIIFDYIGEQKASIFSLSVFSGLVLGCFVLSIINITRIDLNKKNVYLNKEIIDIVKKENPKRLFNMYDYGGELIYNDIKVFVDGRADLYSKYNYNDYINISTGKNDYVPLIDVYGFDYFLISKSYPIYTYIKYNNNYEVIYENKDIILYKKTVN